MYLPFAYRDICKMKLYLGDFMNPIVCEKVSYEELQKLNEESKHEVCGLYFSEYNKIYITSDSNIPTLDLFLHELSHAIIDEQKILKSEEHKCDMLAIRLKSLLQQRKKIYVFTK